MMLKNLELAFDAGELVKNWADLVSELAVLKGSGGMGGLKAVRIHSEILELEVLGLDFGLQKFRS